jgi:hypothetical protein
MTKQTRKDKFPLKVKKGHSTGRYGGIDVCTLYGHIVIALEVQRLTYQLSYTPENRRADWIICRNRSQASYGRERKSQCACKRN